tara:strand:- start:550 stop:864 length:315 start_codon:yes stop_codon:yes gene_type:complete
MNHQEEFKKINPIEPPVPPYDISDYSLPKQAGIILWLFREALSILVANQDEENLASLEKKFAEFINYMIKKELENEAHEKQCEHDSIAEEMLKELDDIDELIDS